MEPISDARLRQIAERHGIDYEPIPDENPLTVITRLSMWFPLEQAEMFDSFADPEAHPPLFAIIVASTPPIRTGLHQVLRENEFYALEHVQESNLPPRIMVLKYTLDRPKRILKIGAPDPLSAGQSEYTEMKPMDKKKAQVEMLFDKMNADEGDREGTLFTVIGTFTASTGAVFSRRFIDHVWLNFFERLLVANGVITEEEMMTTAGLR